MEVENEETWLIKIEINKKKKKKLLLFKCNSFHQAQKGAGC